MATTPTAPTHTDDPDDHLEVMTALVFRSGMGQAVVDAKWDGLRAAFHGFDAEQVAAMTPDDVDRLVGDDRIIRNRRKIQATIHNARALLRLAEDEGITGWLESHPDDAARTRAIRRTFSFLGPSSIPEFLWLVGIEGPPACAS